MVGQLTENPHPEIGLDIGAALARPDDLLLEYREGKFTVSLPYVRSAAQDRLSGKRKHRQPRGLARRVGMEGPGPTERAGAFLRLPTGGFRRGRTGQRGVGRA
jgi:hypothetical protein